MSDNDQSDRIELSRRKILGGIGAVGASGVGAGLGTTALFSDEEGFANNPLEAGELDLEVDWEVDYYNGIDPDPVTISDSDTDGDGEPDLVDDPGPIVDLEDVKPGDVIEHTLSLHLFGNPGFITMDGLLTDDSDNGFTEPEDQVDGVLDNADGTPDGDLDNHLQCVVWFHDEDGLPQEIWNTSYSQREAFIEDLIDGNVTFDTTADEFLFQGTLASLMSTLSGGLLLDPRVNGHVANDYPNSFCFQPSTTQYLGVLCWLPRDIPGVNDNIVQSDRLTYELGFDANQCRNNIADDRRPEQRPTAGVQPLTLEVIKGFGTLGASPVDLKSEVGFDENMVTEVDTSDDAVEFTLDLPQDLNKGAGDQWSLVFDADDNGTVDFRIVFDDFFYQEWDKKSGEWGNKQQPIPEDIETDTDNDIFDVSIPRDRLSDTFSFGGNVQYSEAHPNTSNKLFVGLTPSYDPDTRPWDATRQQTVFLNGPQAQQIGQLSWDQVKEKIKNKFTNKPTFVIELKAFDSKNKPTEIDCPEIFLIRKGNLKNFSDPFDANVASYHEVGYNAMIVKVGTGHRFILGNFNESIESRSRSGPEIKTISPGNSRYIDTAKATGNPGAFYHDLIHIRCPHKFEQVWVQKLATQGSWKLKTDKTKILKKMISAMGPSPVPPELASVEFVKFYAKVRLDCDSRFRHDDKKDEKAK